MQRHPFDALSFVFGVLFVAFGGASLFGFPPLLGLRPGWVLPAVALAAGLWLLASARVDRRPAAAHTATSEPPPPTSGEARSDDPAAGRSS